VPRVWRTTWYTKAAAHNELQFVRGGRWWSAARLVLLYQFH